MNLTLTRNEYREDGIFSTCTDEEGNEVAQTLEHSYGLEPKIPEGEYHCVRGVHRLNGMVGTFDTFEIQGIEGHTGLLFHWGNFNADSEGCVIVGQHKVTQDDGTEMVTNSRQEFRDFMALQDGVDEFTLTVVA